MQTVAATTKPTASQILAAKRAAKKSTQQERALKRAGAVKNVDRNRLSTLSKAQKENIAVMLSGVKVSEDEAVTCSVKMWLSLQDMRYACNQELIRAYHQAGATLGLVLQHRRPSKREKRGVCLP